MEFLFTAVLADQIVQGYLVKAQIILDGVRRVEDGPIGSDDEDKAVESLSDQTTRWLKCQNTVFNAARTGTVHLWPRPTFAAHKC